MVRHGWVPARTPAVAIRVLTAIIVVGCTGMLAGPAAAAEEVPSGVREYEGLSFSEAVPDLKLRLFLPEKTDGPVPCILVIQGGGFAASDGVRFRSFAIHLAESGFAAAVIAYRGRPDHQYLDTVADTKAAVRFVRKVAAEYGIDPARIGAMGRSAGATLVALLAVTADMAEFEGVDGDREFSSRIQAGVAFAGVFNFVSRFTDPRQIATQPRMEEALRRNQEWIGVPFSPESEPWKRVSAINHVDAEDAPMLFLHCRDDSTVPWMQSQEMCEAMRSAGVEAAVRYYDAGGHGFQVGDREQPLVDMVRFFRRHLAQGDGDAAPAARERTVLDTFRKQTHTLPEGRRMNSYTRPGDNPALVLIPGTWGDFHRFAPLIARLPETLPIVVMELCWQGGLVPPSVDLTMEQLADDTLRVVEELGLARFYVGGHSIGGMIAVEIAGRDVPGLVGALPMEGWTHHTVVQTAFDGVVVGELTPEQAAQSAAERAAGRAHLSEEQCAAVATIWQRWNGYAALTRSAVPQCHLWGDRGKPRPDRRALQIPDRPSIEVAWIAGASHPLLLQAPDAVAEVVRRFIEAHP